MGNLVGNIARIADASTVDGPGVRTTIWFQGCRNRCPGCQNEALQDPAGGNSLDVVALGHMLRIVNVLSSAAGNHLYTVTGGEPFDQPLALALMLSSLRAHDPDAHVIVYTGYTWELLQASGRKTATERLAMQQIDVLVDGPYIAELDDDKRQYVGSSNQRVIRVKESLESGQLVLEDWDSAALFTILDGQVTMAGGWLEEVNVAGIGTVTEAPLCGQAERGKGSD